MNASVKNVEPANYIRLFGKAYECSPDISTSLWVATQLYAIFLYIPSTLGDLGILALSLLLTKSGSKRIKDFIASIEHPSSVCFLFAVVCYS